MFHENAPAKASNLKIRFFWDGERDMVSIAFHDSKDEIVRPVEARDIERFPLEWQAYDGARPRETVVGTPLTEIPGLGKETATDLRLRGFPTCERLADLDDYVASQIGHQGVAWRDMARLVLKAKAADAKTVQAKAVEKRVA